MMVSRDADSAAGEDEDGSRSDRIDQLGLESMSAAVEAVLVDDRCAVCARGCRTERRSARRQARQTDMFLTNLEVPARSDEGVKGGSVFMLRD